MPKGITLPEVLLVAVLVAAPIVAQVFAPGVVGLTVSSISVILAFLKQRNTDVLPPAGDA